MTSTIIEFLIGPNGIFFWLAALVAGALAYGAKSGSDREKLKASEKEAKARGISDQVENDLGAMTPEQRKEALRKWSRQ